MRLTAAQDVRAARLVQDEQTVVWSGFHSRSFIQPETNFCSLVALAIHKDIGPMMIEKDAFWTNYGSRPPWPCRSK